MNRTLSYGAKIFANQIPQKVLLNFDSQTVAMEVGIRLGVCNNSLTEFTSPENGWRFSEVPILSH